MMSTQRFDLPTSEADEGQVNPWQVWLQEAAQCLRPCFSQRRAWQRAVAYLEGLLSNAQRKNAWQLAEVSGDATPYAFQHLLGRALWCADQLRDFLYACVVQHRWTSTSSVPRPC